MSEVHRILEPITLLLPFLDSLLEKVLRTLLSASELG